MTDQTPQNSKTPQEFISELQQKNLVFFQRHFKSLYESISKLSLKSTKINIDTRTGEVDLIDKDISCYQGKGITFALKEVDDWEKAYPNNRKICTLRPPFEGDYNRPRFFSRQINSLVKDSPVNKSSFDWYKHENPADMVVFLGIGLGLHIQEYLERHDVRNIILFENNPEHFLASLYVVDWELIFGPYIGDSSRTLRLLLREFDDDRDITACIWNELITYCPHFPASCLFFNHRRSSVYGNTIRKLQQDVHVYMNLWGYYDDEINQLTNGYYNFRSGIKKTPSHKEFELNAPVVIIGSGPSLDDRIDELRAIKEKAVLISCGTALRSLYAHGIKPDIHVEIESHLLTYELLSQIDNSWLREIKFIGAAQINPRNFTLFDNSMAFIKDSSTMAGLFCKPEEIIKGTTPTCTNTGLAIALYYKSREIYLFGVDFGFPSVNRHHTKNSIYYQEDADDRIQNSVAQLERSLLKETSVKGEKMYTKPSYYTSRRRAEVEILRAIKTLKDIKVFNFSNGAAIENTDWLSSSEGSARISNLKDVDKKSLMKDLFERKSASIEPKTTEIGIEKIEKFLTMLNKKLPPIIDRNIEKQNASSAICTEVNHYLEQVVKNENPHLYYMIRGSIWHYLYTLYTHSWAAKSADQHDEESIFIEKWAVNFKEFLSNLPLHAKNTLSKFRDIDDDWLNTSMENPVEE